MSAESPYVREVTVTLQEPIPVCLANKGQPVSEVTFRRPKVKDIKAIEGLSQIATGSKLIEMLSTPSLSKSEIEQMDFADYTRCDEAIGRFLSRSPKTPASAKDT